MSIKKLFLLSIIIFLSVEILAKEKSTLFNGIWQSGQDEKSFMLIKEYDVLTLYNCEMYPHDYHDNITLK